MVNPMVESVKNNLKQTNPRVMGGIYGMCLKMKDPVNRLNRSCEFLENDSCLVRNTPNSKYSYHPVIP